MPSIINALTASGGGVAITGDATGNLALQTAGNTAVTVNTSKGVQFDNCIGVGNATPSTSGAGITFPATQSASTDANTLDDYEEGTFSPNVIGTTTAGTVTYGDRVGRYTKIGNRVFFTIYITWSSGTGSGNLKFSNLPFISANNSEYPTLAIYTNNVNYTSGNTVTCYVAPNDTTVSFLQSVPNSGAIGLPYDANVDGFIVSGHYPAA